VGLATAGDAIVDTTPGDETRTRSGAATDGGIGFLKGVLGGLPGLPGFIITVWCQMRGWTKDEQRAVFQPVILTGMMMIAISLSVASASSITGSDQTQVRSTAAAAPGPACGMWRRRACRST
jgi:hypothetical protein